MSKNDTPQDPAASLTTLMETMREAGLKSMPSLGTNMLEAMADMGAEMLSFTAARVQQDVQTQHDLMHAKGLAEVQHIQAQFFQKAMDDYAAETAKLLKMGKSLAPEPARSSD